MACDNIVAWLVVIHQSDEICTNLNLGKARFPGLAQRFRDTDGNVLESAQKYEKPGVKGTEFIEKTTAVISVGQLKVQRRKSGFHLSWKGISDRRNHPKLLAFIEFERVRTGGDPDYIRSFEHRFEADALFANISRGVVTSFLGTLTDSAESLHIPR